MSAAAPLQNLAAKPQPLSSSTHAGLLLQRKCACGSPTSSLTGECAECKSKKRLQTKLTIGASNDPLEQEADRIADQVMAAPAHHAVSGAPPHIQRFAGQASGETGTAPASVDRALSSPGRPLDPALQQDMGKRFGHDFSRVRVHSGAAAEQSARDVNAHAYTVGNNMVFRAGQFAPRTQEGRRLIAHELTHVVQQSGADRIRADQSNEKRGLSPIALGLQTKLRISEPGDAYEQEADRVAKEVMRIPEPKAGEAAHERYASPLVQRRVSGGSAGFSAAPPIVGEVLSSPGEPLDAKTRAFFEPRFGHDFSQVRVHTDAKAGASARSINSSAYTTGRQLVFGNGHYSPDTHRGKELLAHELAHVIQQQAGGNGNWPIQRSVCSESELKEYMPVKENYTRPDRTTVQQLSRIHPEFGDKFPGIGFDLEHPVEADCSGDGQRFLVIANNKGLFAVDLCKFGEVLKYKIVCTDQSEPKKCSDQTPQQIIESGTIIQAEQENKMRDLLNKIHGPDDGRDTTAIVLACDAEDGLFYYQVASSDTGEMRKRVVQAAKAEGVQVTAGEQTELASAFVRSEEGRQHLREVYPEEADQILEDLKSKHTPTKEAAQLKVYDAFKEYPNLHAEREAIYAILDKGDKPILVMPSRAACVVCKEYVKEFDVILLLR